MRGPTEAKGERFRDCSARNALSRGDQGECFREASARRAVHDHARPRCLPRHKVSFCGKRCDGCAGVVVDGNPATR